MKKLSGKALQFEVEAAYGQSIAASMFGDSKVMIASLRRALQLRPDYAPAILSLGSIEYQRRRKAAGRKLFLSLPSLPDDAKDLCEIIDKAGDFLIGIHEYRDGLELYRAAVKRFPGVAVLQQGQGCCAGHEGLFEEALAASERALELEPCNQQFVSDLGWTLFLAGRLEEAEKTLERAVSMNRADGLARENLRYCREKMAGGGSQHEREA